MNNCVDGHTTVTRALVPDDKRLSHIEALFGAHFPLLIEPVIYGITEQMAEGYQGGFWQFWRLSNGGFYMTPEGDTRYQVSCMNYWQGELSADALGIVSCLTAYSHLSFGGPNEFAQECARHFYWLREYLMDHPEVAAILGAID